MVYIIQKSKRSARRREIKLELNEAKEFLYNIDNRRFRINVFIVYCSDEIEEMQELLNYFNDEYMVEHQEEVVTVYKINEEIPKYNRLRNNGATVKVLNNFKNKIQKAIPGSEVSIVFYNDTFDVLIEHPIGDIKIVCNYQLEIDKAFASNHEGKFVDINKNDAIVKIVNQLFRNQRYYYKSKNKNG